MYCDLCKEDLEILCSCCGNDYCHGCFPLSQCLIIGRTISISLCPKCCIKSPTDIILDLK